MSLSWYPMIDFQRCNGCFACIETCENDVFEVNGNMITVASRDRCVDGCKQCKTYCMTKAIVFEDEMAEMVRQGYMKCDCGSHVHKGE